MSRRPGARGSYPGKFITLEGGEGAGKSTQAKLLAGRLTDAGIETILTREPGGSPGAEEIRALLVSGEPGRWQPMTEVLLHYAARLDHLARTVIPALKAGTWVISDRFADSTVAYQGYGHQLGADAIADLHDIVLGEFAPDVTLILDLPAAEGLSRTGARAENKAEDRYERMGPEFHERVREGFRAIAAASPDRCAVVDAGRAPKAVHEAVWQAIAARTELAA